MRIIVTEKISENGIKIMREAGAEVDVKFGMPREELLDVISGYDAIVVRSVTKVNDELLEKGTNLKVVGRAGNGVDNIDMDAATKRGIIVVNTPDANSISAAEHTIGLLISACRNIPHANAYLKSLEGGDWDRSPFKGVELYNKILGIVGLGRIGSLVATRMQAFGMKVIAYDPYITDERFRKYGVEKKDTLDDLVREADFITVHTPLTEETKGMIGEAELAIAKKGVRVVNCARGGIVEENALTTSIQSGQVAAAGIDVLLGEPKPISPLLKVDKTIVTPHLGADTVEAQENVGISIAHEVMSALKGDMVPNAVNMPTLLAQELDAVRPYLAIGEVLGKMYHQLKKDPVDKVEIIYRGEVAKMEISVITLAVLKGLLEPVLKERVNYVNASMLAESRDITVTESRQTVHGSFTSLIEVNIGAKGNTYCFAGSVFGKGNSRIVEMFGYEFDVVPSKFMLVVENNDKPGMIGQIGTLLGAAGVNIATMQVSRNVQGKNAMMVLTIDTDVSKEVLNIIRNVDGIESVYLVRL